MFRLIVIVMTFILSSCAAKTAYISSQTDPAYSPRKTDPIFLLVPDNAPIESRNFSAFLAREMQAAGFNMVTRLNESRYVLLVNSGQKTSQINSTLFIPKTQTTSGYVGNTYYSGQTTSTTAVPYSRDYTVHKVWLNLYSTSDAMDGRYRTAWEGYIGAEASEFRSQSREIVHLLLNVFGKNYQAHTPIRAISSK